MINTLLNIFNSSLADTVYSGTLFDVPHKVLVSTDVYEGSEAGKLISTKYLFFEFMRSETMSVGMTVKWNNDVYKLVSKVIEDELTVKFEVRKV